LVGIAAAELVKKAIQRAILKSVGREGIPAYSDFSNRKKEYNG